jgi:head decoration protein D
MDAGILKTVSPDGRGAGHFISGQCDPNLCNDHITIKAAAGALVAGTVLGQISKGAVGAAVVTAGAGNAGDGVFAAAPTLDAGGPGGNWTVEITQAAANAGDFRVTRPDGSIDGYGTVAVAYNGGINFTLNDGAADFAEGDSFNVALNYAAGSGHYVLHDAAAVDGSEVAKCILWDDRANNAAAQRATGTFRNVPVNGNALTWKAGITNDQRNAAIAALAEAGLMVRY